MSQDIVKSQLSAMLDLQDAFNKKVHPEWMDQGFAWDQALFAELGELLEHVGYKWWKKQTPDANQLIMELVDIWHFGMSLDLVISSTYDDNMHAPSREQLLDGYASSIQHASSLDNSVVNYEIFRQQIMIVANWATNVEPLFDAHTFFEMWYSLGLTLDDLYKRYVGKNSLNEFRQLNGYKAGTYIKIWSGREDNEYLTDILENVTLDENLYNTVLDQLAVEYSKL